MIQMQTSLTVADNSGAKRVVMIMPVGGSTSKIARLGDTIKVNSTRPQRNRALQQSERWKVLDPGT